MALKIFKGSISFSDKILTRELMNSVHKISRPKGKYVKNISKVRWDKNDLSWNKSLIYLFSKLKAVNIFVQWNQMLHFWVLRTASTSVCPKRLASSAGVKPHLQVKKVLKYFFFHEFPKPEFCLFNGQSELITLVSILVLVFFSSKRFHWPEKFMEFGF